MLLEQNPNSLIASIHVGLSAINSINSQYSRPPLTYEDVWVGYPAIDFGLLDTLQSNASQDLKQLMEAVSNPAIKVVSFNLFGTLLLRPYAKPSDIFMHLAQIHNVPEFPEIRAAAEKSARKKVKNGEINIFNIYEDIKADNTSGVIINNTAQDEINLELSTL